MSFQALRDTLLKTLEAFEDSSFSLKKYTKLYQSGFNSTNIV